MFDFKIKVFLAVAQRLSFSKAADTLHITQPAVTRHIKQIEDHFNQKLFIRKGSSIELTHGGCLLMERCKAMLQEYSELEFEMNALVDNVSGSLRLAASTTLAQYIFPELLAGFHQKYPKLDLELVSTNTEGVEHLLLNGDVDIGFTEGRTKNSELSYHQFLKDEIVFLVSKDHPLFNQREQQIEILYDLPIVLRERGSGTLEHCIKALSEKGIHTQNLNVAMQLGNSESIKSYISKGTAGTFLSINTVLKELKFGQLGIIDFADFTIERQFQYVQRHGHHSPRTQTLVDYLLLYYKR